ncbi:MAG: methyl-accepting chemotaxis protein [Candidatus Parvarchaeota archaeon]|nr:methyl-accepting chemotaxis protein [Candidatus Parvarchaeum tengchongense]
MLKLNKSLVLRLKIYLILGACLILVFVGLGFFFIPKFYFTKNLAALSDSIKSGLLNVFELQRRLDLNLGLLLANDPQIKAIYLELKKEVKDLGKVTEENRSIYEKYGKELRRIVEQKIEELEKEMKHKPRIHFTLPNARSFLRIWRKPGEDVRLDDLSKIRHTIVIAEREKRIVSAIEGGRDGISYRTVVPIMHGGEFLGTVDSGERLEVFVKTFAELNKNVLGYFILADKKYANIMEQAVKEGRVKVIPEGVLYVKEGEIDEKEISTVAKESEKGKTFFVFNDKAYILLPIEDFQKERVGIIAISFDIKEQLSLYRKLVFASLGALVLFLVIYIGILTKLIKRELSYIETTEAHVKALATSGGDLTYRIPVVKEDEIGRLTSSFNSFIDSLASMVKKLLLGVENLFNSIFALQRETDLLKDHMNTFKEKANDINQVSQDILHKMEEISYSIQEFSKAITEIAQRAQESASMVKQTVEKVNLSKENVEVLNKASIEIEEVVNFITTIAEQTNLLALNATIEAARAGEAGKGFAVVANEVKELAKRTQEAAKEVIKRITLLQNSSSLVKQNVDDVVEFIKAVEDASASIAAAVEEQSVVVNSISNFVLAVNDKVMLSETHTQEIIKEADKLATLIETLQKISQQMNDVAKEIKEEMNKFKV